MLCVVLSVLLYYELTKQVSNMYYCNGNKVKTNHPGQIKPKLCMARYN